MTKTEDLKACPLCGGVAVTWYDEHEKRVQCGVPAYKCPLTKFSMSVDEWQSRPAVAPTNSAMEDAAQREPAEMVETLKEGTSPRLEGTSSTTDGDAERALEAVQAWFDSIEWREETGKPFKYKDSEEVLYKHGETIRNLLRYMIDGMQSTRKPPVTVETKVAFKALEVNYKRAEENQDETVWLLPIHAERILDYLASLDAVLEGE